MQPPQLLMETERAAGDSKLLEQHMELISKKKLLKGLQSVPQFT